jgi:ribosome-associated toxin RatA of RatAB toxin-antitoxin module
MPEVAKTFSWPGSFSFVSAVASAIALTAALTLPSLALPLEPSGAFLNATGNKMEETTIMEGHQTQTSDGKSYQITRAVINAAPEDVFGIIVDYKHSGLLFSNLTRSQVLSRDENTKTSNVSFSLRGILNLWSFDYVLAIKENFPSSIEFHRLSGAFKRNEGYWRLLPLDNGRRTEVVYGKYIDAGSIMPPQIVAKEVRESTASVVENLKRVAENQRLLKVPG